MNLKDFLMQGGPEQLVALLLQKFDPEHNGVNLSMEDLAKVMKVCLKNGGHSNLVMWGVDDGVFVNMITDEEVEELENLDKAVKH